MDLDLVKKPISVEICPDGAVAKSSAKSSANGLVGTGFNPEWVFVKAQWVGVRATTPCSFSLTSNRVTTNYY